MSHKKRILLEYLPSGINILISGIVFFMIACLHPNRIIPKESIFEMFEKGSVGDIIFATFCTLPMWFSMAIILKNDYLDIKMKNYDKKNGTKTYEAYYDESYESNRLSSSSAALTLCLLIAVIELFIFLFVKAIPDTTLSIMGLGIFPVGIYMIFYSLFFYVSEDDMLYSDDSLENVVA